MVRRTLMHAATDAACASASHGTGARRAQRHAWKPLCRLLWAVCATLRASTRATSPPGCPAGKPNHMPPCRPAALPPCPPTGQSGDNPPRSCHRRRLHTHGDQRLQHRRLCCVRPGHVQEHARSLLQGGAAALSRVRCQRVRPSRRISVPLHVRHAARGRADPAACLSHARARNAGDSRAGPV